VEPTPQAVVDPLPAVNPVTPATPPAAKQIAPQTAAPAAPAVKQQPKVQPASPLRPQQGHKTERSPIQHTSGEVAAN